MLDLHKILAKVENKDDLIKQIEAEMGKDFVARTDFNAKNEELKTVNAQLKERDKQLEALSTAEGDKAELQRQIKDLKDANKAAADAHATAVKNLRLEAEMDKLVTDFMPDTRDFIKSLIKKDATNVNDQEGTILGLKEQMDAIRESRKSLLMTEAPEAKPAFTKGATPSAPQTMTREQILAIPNTIDRQRAIASNLSLFEGGN